MTRLHTRERGAFNYRDALVLGLVAVAAYAIYLTAIPFYHSFEVRSTMGSTWRDYMQFGKDNAALAVKNKLKELVSEGIPLNPDNLQVTKDPNGTVHLRLDFDETVDYGQGVTYSVHLSPTADIEQ